MPIAFNDETSLPPEYTSDVVNKLGELYGSEKALLDVAKSLGPVCVERGDKINQLEKKNKELERKLAIALTALARVECQTRLSNAVLVASHALIQIEEVKE